MSPEQCLHKALRQNDRNAVREILNEAKVNINGLYYGMTPLMVAVSKGYTEAALTLLDKGADSAIRDVDGSSVFEQAVLKNQVQVVKRLVKRNIFLNEKLKNGHTALTYSAQKKHSALTEVLVDGGADVNMTNANGETPLFIAAFEGNADVMRCLLKGNVQLDVQCGKEQLTPLMASVANDHINTTRLLIQKGSNVDYCDANGWTALWHAVSDHNIAMVTLLMKSGADTMATDSDGRSLMEEAKEREMDDIALVLQSKIC